MKLGLVLDILRRIAPEHLAESWDQVGLHLGDPAWRIRTALLCIDLTPPVLAEAIEASADLIVAYHPPIFEPLQRLTSAHWKSRLLLEAARRRIALYSPHTALDSAAGGLNDWLAQGLGKGRITPLKPAASGPRMKIVTFVPSPQIDQVRKAMAGEGAGRIGDYRLCSFSVSGQGTFQGSARTQPTVGKAGRFETVQEFRLEMVVPKGELPAVLAALRQAHPYEQPAIDLYDLATASPSSQGAGRLLVLEKAMTLRTLIEGLKTHLGVPHVQATSIGSGKIQRVGICAGAGGSLLAGSSQKHPLEAIVTGEMRHHDQIDATARGTAVILAGHSQTERPYLKVYSKRLARQSGPGVRWIRSRRDRPPTRLS